MTERRSLCFLSSRHVFYSHGDRQVNPIYIMRQHYPTIMNIMNKVFRMEQIGLILSSLELCQQYLD